MLARHKSCGLIPLHSLHAIEATISQAWLSPTFTGETRRVEMHLSSKVNTHSLLCWNIETRMVEFHFFHFVLRSSLASSQARIRCASNVEAKHRSHATPYLYQYHYPVRPYLVKQRLEGRGEVRYTLKMWWGRASSHDNSTRNEFSHEKISYPTATLL